MFEVENDVTCSQRHICQRMETFTSQCQLTVGWENIVLSTGPVPLLTLCVNFVCKNSVIEMTQRTYQSAENIQNKDHTL